ncbi:DNA double-strand break repair nuclease NurA [Halorussus halobius]|uniref:DNA double-strand break repair nuclease NurA n=1 Tax=Halorussus halobius TaxID=1710537 RepID=UPI0010924486|nr:DNA double-strand break repair nuclease NurA [Halorussus halobius]
MTLDPAHFDGIAGLADRIDYDAADEDHRDAAETVWEHYLDPLRDAEGVVLEPLDDLARRRVDAEAVALEDPPFPTTHGLDAGTLNPQPFKNGLVLDVAHAAMCADPSDLPLHDRRTVVKAVHSNDASTNFGTEWERYDEGSRRRIVHTHLPHDQYEEDVVHALALYLAESTHALDHADRVEDLLVLDGPIYPTGVLRWYYRSPALTDLFEESDHVARILDNYVELVETFVDRGVPFAGFVKNLSSKGVVRTLKRDTDFGPVPWAHDAGLFAQMLERRESVDGEFERLTDELTFTNWFASTGGMDRFFSDAGNPHLDRDLAPEQYEVTFCVVYDPRRDLVFKVEAPRAFTDDPDVRERIERGILREVAVQRGPPRAVAKADELAAIDHGSAESLVKSFERSLDTELDDNYNAVRWGRNY